MTKPVLILFDGHALIHRAFHALPPLNTSKTGEPTGAVYGFVRMLLKAVQEFQPTHWAIAFDRSTPTFRHVLFEEYKAQRPKAPDELIAQIGRVKEIVEALNIPAFELDGYEADDILGTLVDRANEQGLDVLIMTGDADTMQLVSPNTRVLVPQKAFGDVTLYDEAAVQQRYGVRPAQIPDFKGLKGDPSDNISGVPGIGDKTAKLLLEQFGSIEGIYEHIDEVTPDRIREALLAEKEKAELSKELATIKCDAPISLQVANCEVKSYEHGRLEELFRELEFFSMLDRLPEIEERLTGQRTVISDAGGGVDDEFQLVDTLLALDDLVQKLANTPRFALSLATGTKGSGVLIGIALSLGPGDAYYVPVGHKGWEPQLELSQTLQRLAPILENPSIAKVVHDGKETLTVLRQFGIELQNMGFDTMIAAYLLGEKALDVRALASSKLGVQVTPPSGLVGAKRATVADLGVSVAANYLAATVDAIGRLREPLESELRKQELWQLFSELEMPLVEILARMEGCGVALDTQLLGSMSKELEEQLRILERDIYENVGHEFNINSPQQLGNVLFKELHLPGAKRTKTGYSTDAATMEALKGAHPIIELVQEYRQLMKLKSTYVDALPALIDSQTGRVHTTLNQTATATGRLSSSEPNLQNIPVRGELGRQIRFAFVAEPPCVLVGADYSQVELRVLAHFSQDPLLVEAFRNDEDIHNATASQVFGVSRDEVSLAMRRVAKVVNFGVVYGMSEYGLEQATDLSRGGAAEFIKAYFEKYAKMKEYLDSSKEQAREQGYVQTLFGRRRYVPEIKSANRQIREAAERMAINMPIQGTAADIIKLAMIRIQNELDQRGSRTRMILQVHDELLFEVPPEEVEEVTKMVEQKMSRVVGLSVPLKVDIKVGSNWGQME